MTYRSELATTYLWVANQTILPLINRARVITRPTSQTFNNHNALNRFSSIEIQGPHHIFLPHHPLPFTPSQKPTTSPPTPPTNQQPKTATMLLKTFLLPFLGAVALAAPTPGEVKPYDNELAPGEPTWYCEWQRHIIYDHYALTGTNWNATESGLKQAIGSHGGWITAWYFAEETLDGEQEIEVSVSCHFFAIFVFAFAFWRVFMPITYSSSLPFCFCCSSPSSILFTFPFFLSLRILSNYLPFPRTTYEKKYLDRGTEADVLLFFSANSGSIRSACIKMWTTTCRNTLVWGLRTASIAVGSRCFCTTERENFDSARGG
jgi:hypothetical protein